MTAQAPPGPDLLDGRLLQGLAATGHPASLAEHLARYGPLPDGRVRRGGDPALVAAVEQSGLLGRGGAGFPTGRKMRTVASARRTTVVVGNGMEGEPAAGKDALLLAVAPHLVLDGMEVAARAVGADRAHLAVHRGSATAAFVRAAVAERPPPRGLTLTVEELPPHYVSSEESALVHWLNGGEGKPLFVPPRPFERGVGGRPTLINNVETLAQLALISRYGAAWFRSMGDADEPGTMLLTVSGAVRHPGVIEVPTGILLSAALGVAGRVPEPLQAVVVGGYFGTWLPSAVAPSLPLTHAGLRSVGGALGAGIVVAFPASACGLAETARVVGYLAGQTAGQCGPCVHGLRAIAGTLHDLAHGPWRAAQRTDLDRWMGVVPGRGACRHPDGAVRFAASALQVFAEDVRRHETVGPCPAAFREPLLPIGGPLGTTWR